MILCDGEIRQACHANGTTARKAGTEPLVVPYLEENVQPASIDVRLGNTFRVFERDNTPYIDLRNPKDITKEVVVPDGDHFMLHNGEFVLAHTIEVVNVQDNMVARIEGKSSLGRMGIFVHVTAGFIDPGFRGPITLEMACLHPLAVALYPGDLIAQISFQWMSAPAEQPYRGRYQDAKGVEPSRYTGTQQHPTEVVDIHKTLEQPTVELSSVNNWRVR